MIQIRNEHFVDEHGRTLILRGVNLGGSSKVPLTPNGDTRFKESLQQPRDCSFVGRPFPLAEAEEHFARLRKWGFPFVRFLATWEAVEHAGPGIYDQAYLDYLAAVLEKAHEAGIQVLIDPHQDVWSRFTGGDGAPAWTLEAVGMDPASLSETAAAVLQCESGDFYPPLIWATNALKLGAATLFTLFFAGSDFAPLCKVDGEPVQEYLQGHYIEAMRQVALRLKDLPNVFGFDTLNEPNCGYIGWKDLSQALALANMGFNPSPYQSMLLADGQTLELDFWQPGLPKSRSLGKRPVNPNRARLWREDCLWRRHGVWDVAADGQPRLLRPDYFASRAGREVDFNQDYLRPFANRYAAAICSVQPRAAIFVESMPGLPAPRWMPEDAPGIVHAPHWYDLYHIVTNDFISWLALDGKSGKPVIGQAAIRRAFAAHLAAVKAEARHHLGGVPTHIGEFGVSFDIKKGKAFKTGDFQLQVAVMDRTFRAIEDSLLSGTIWDYTADNTNQAKDHWNAQDYSIFSRDQQSDPADIHSGGRALAAVVRPYASKVAGEALRMAFDLESRQFVFEFRHDPQINAPTELYIPDYQYPGGCLVEVSDGSYEFLPEAQTLRYQHSLDRPLHCIEVTPRPGFLRLGDKAKVQSPRQYLSDAILWGAGINFFLNLLAGWLIYRQTPFFPLLGAEGSVNSDAAGMTLIIVFFSLLLAVPTIKRLARNGQLLKIANAPRFPRPLHWLLQNTALVSLGAAFASVYVIVPPAVGLLGWLGLDGLSLGWFLAFKAVLAAFVAATAVPLLDWLVLLNLSAKRN